MPLYEYRCKQCDQVFEKIQKFSDEPLSAHEGCGGAVERLISAPGLHFKGSGFYITDYARAGTNGKSDTPSSGSTEGKNDGKSDKKSSDSKTESTTSKTESKPTPATSGSSSKAAD